MTCVYVGMCRLVCGENMDSKADEDGLRVDAVLFNAELSAWRGSRVWSAMLSRLHAKWVKPDIFTFGATLEGVGVSSQWLQACAIVSELQEAGAII